MKVWARRAIQMSNNDIRPCHLAHLRRSLPQAHSKRVGDVINALDPGRSGDLACGGHRDHHCDHDQLRQDRSDQRICAL